MTTRRNSRPRVSSPRSAQVVERPNNCEPARTLSEPLPATIADPVRSVCARTAAVMLYKLLVYVLLIASADALKAGPISRRALLGKATAGAFLSSPLAAFAQEPLKQASDASVYDRADEGALTSARVIQRAKDGQLVVGKGMCCSPLMAARRPPQTAHCTRRLLVPPSPGRNRTPALRVVVLCLERTPLL